MSKETKPVIYRIIDNYTEITESESPDRAALEKELKKLQDETGLFIWRIEPAAPAPAYLLLAEDGVQAQSDNRAELEKMIKPGETILTRKNPPVKTELYIAQLVVKCRVCGDETLVSIGEHATPEAVIAEINAAYKETCLNVKCYADPARAQALTELEEEDSRR